MIRLLTHAPVTHAPGTINPRWLTPTCLGLMLLGSSMATAGDCNCRKAKATTAPWAASAYGASDWGAISHPDANLQWHPDWSGSPPQLLGPQNGPAWSAQQFAQMGPLAQPPVNVEANRFDVAPPPGTLGRTYQQRSRLLEEDQHPRLGVVEIRLPEDVDVTSRGLKSVWTGKVWRLESKEPLIPGLSHIYAIKAEKRSADGDVISTDVRWVRLIMGRIVDLEF